MSFGKMNTDIQLVSTTAQTDKDGFSKPTELVLATVRAYKEDRNTSEKWTNMAVFSTATSFFRFRCIPDVVVDTTQIILCAGDCYKILSVENVRGRGLYYEVLAERVMPSG